MNPGPGQGRVGRGVAAEDRADAAGDPPQRLELRKWAVEAGQCLAGGSTDRRHRHRVPERRDQQYPGCVEHGKEVSATIPEAAMAYSTHSAYSHDSGRREAPRGLRIPAPVADLTLG